MTAGALSDPGVDQAAHPVGSAGIVLAPWCRGAALTKDGEANMRELIGMEPTCVATGQNATASTVDGCSPVRPYDVVDCPQSAMGKVANDIANGSATVVGMIADSAKALWGSIFGD